MSEGTYYVPHGTHWPIIGSIGLATMLTGAANWLHAHPYGHWMFIIGAIIIVIMMFGWFGEVIRENLAGKYDHQVDKSFRWGMAWFIFSEVCFFAVFFGTLYYTRELVVPWLSGSGSFEMTHLLLWPNFKDVWPLLVNPDNTLFVGAKTVVDAWGLPAINTAILLTSGATITWAHWGLKKDSRKQLVLGLFLTVVLGCAFLACQAHEYYLAYTEHGLTLGSGIYGSTFFLLTGFHGLHVTVGTIMLFVVMLRAMKGHFTEENHFAFEAAAWYWHFVDVVWLLLFVFVYWI